MASEAESAEKLLMTRNELLGIVGHFIWNDPRGRSGRVTICAFEMQQIANEANHLVIKNNNNIENNETYEIIIWNVEMAANENEMKVYNEIPIVSQLWPAEW